MRANILLGCARKYLALLNGQSNGPITSLLYFRGLLDEVGQLPTSEYWNYVKLRVQRLEAQWLVHSTQTAGANFAQASQEKT